MTEKVNQHIQLDLIWAGAAKRLGDTSDLWKSV